MLPPPPAADAGSDAGSDAGATTDAGIPDAGAIDAGAVDGGAVDAGAVDAGEIDAGPMDAGQMDAGTDGGTDGGIVFGGPGPWPQTNVTYGAAQGIQEQPIVGMTTDETQNIWVATHQALYLLQPGQSQFHRYAAPDGLHLQGNPILYCDTWQPDADGGVLPCVFGGASDPGITEVVGGGTNEVFVGYAGTPDPDIFCVNDILDARDHASYGSDRCDPNRHTGKLDRVRLNPDGTLSVVRFDMTSTNHGMLYWHNRTVSRMLFDHFIHPHELYVGTNHGVNLFRPDLYAPNQGQYIDVWQQTFMADHLHARVCYHAACPQDSEANQRMGGWRGLALAPDGNLWHAGKWNAGKLLWDPILINWNQTPRPPPPLDTGLNACNPCFGDPYPDGNNPDFVNEPVFRPPLEGDPVDLSAVSVAPDGRVWFASAPDQTGDPAYGVAVWNGQKFTVYDPATLGLPEAAVRDLLVLADGRIVLAGANSGLAIYDPNNGSHVSIRAGQGIPDDQVTRLELDNMVSPPALHVSTWSGATTLRQLPH